MAPEAVEPNPQVMTHGHEDATMGVWGEEKRGPSVRSSDIFLRRSLRARNR